MRGIFWLHGKIYLLKEDAIGICLLGWLVVWLVIWLFVWFVRPCVFFFVLLLDCLVGWLVCWLVSVCNGLLTEVCVFHSCPFAHFKDISRWKP